MKETDEIKKDNALRQLMQPAADTQLPFRFTDRMMERIEAEAKRKARRQEIILYSVVSLFSLALITGAVIGLSIFSSFNIGHEFKLMFRRITESGNVGFYVFIGICTLLLLYLDHIMRQRYNARHKEENSL